MLEYCCEISFGLLDCYGYSSSMVVYMGLGLLQIFWFISFPFRCRCRPYTWHLVANTQPVSITMAHG